MMRYLYLLAMLLIVAPGLVCADQIRLPGNTVFNYELPSSRWQASTETPELAVAAMVVDMAHDKQKKGEPVDFEMLREKARKFLAVNNFYIFNPDTEAYLMVSFSPLKRSDGPLTPDAVQQSVRWTVTALGDHAEVEDLGAYSTSVETVEISGTEYAQQIFSDNPLFGEPHNFIGVIGYTYPYWVFMFYNDKADDPEDLSEMKAILNSVALSVP